MAVDETLRAVVSAKDSITGVFGAIQGSAEGVSDALEETAHAGVETGGSFDYAENAGEELDEALDDVAGGAGVAMGALSGVDESAEGSAVSMASAVPPIEGYGEALDNLPSDAFEAVAANEAVAESADEAGDEFTETAGEAGILAGALSGLSAVELGSLGLGDADVSRTTANVQAFSSALRNLPSDALSNLDGGALNEVAIALDGVPDDALQSLDVDTVRRLSDTIEGMPADKLGDVLPDDFGESFAGAGAAQAYAEGLDETAVSAAQAAAANAVVQDSIDEAGDEMGTGAAEAGLYSRAIDSVRNAAGAAVGPLKAYEHAADEAGDTSAASAAQVGTLGAAMGGVGGAGGLGASFAGIRGSLSSIALLASAVLPIILTLGTAFGGLGLAIAGVAGIVGAGIFGGLLAQGEQAAATTEGVEGAFEGIGEVLSEFKPLVEDALEPLQAPIFQNLALDTLYGAVTLFGDFAEFAARTYRELEPIVDIIAGAWWDQEPAFFDALHDAAVTLAPAFADLMVWLASAIPEAMRFMTSTTVDLLPILSALGGVIIDILPPLVELGGTILSVVGPPLVWLVGVIADAVSWFNSLPAPIKKGAIAAAIAIPVLSALAGVISLVAGAAATAGGVMALLTGILLSPVVIIGALIGVLVAVIDHFKLWDELIAGLQVTWNLLVEALAWGANLIGNVIEDMANGFIGLANAAIKAYNLIPGRKDIDLIGKVDIPEVDAEGLKTDVTGKLGGGGGDSGGGAGGSGPDYPDMSGGGGGGGAYSPSITVDARGSDMSEGRVQSLVEDVLREDRRRRNKRQGPDQGSAY